MDLESKDRIVALAKVTEEEEEALEDEAGDDGGGDDEPTGPTVH
jgi:hypothetical protein